MAGPVSTDEIEDFVSSMRRLVSIQVHDLPSSRDPGADRLVLTSAQRVATDGTGRDEPLILTARVKDERGAEQYANGRPEPAPVDAVQLVEAVWEEELWDEPEAPLAELALGLEEAELVPDPVVTVPDPVATVPDPVVTVPDPVASIPDPVPSTPDPVAAAAETEEDASPWAEVGDDWLDEDLELLAPGQTTPGAGASEDPVAQETAAKRPDVLKLSAEDMLTDGEGNPLTVLDEAALQVIIRQLIRDELKGVLGERITHSVRKLVRAEINRALAAHALD